MHTGADQPRRFRAGLDELLKFLGTGRILVGTTAEDEQQTGKKEFVHDHLRNIRIICYIIKYYLVNNEIAWSAPRDMSTLREWPVPASLKVLQKMRAVRESRLPEN